MPGYRNTVVLAVRSGARATQECVCEMCVREIANNQRQRALGLCLERESRSPSRRLRSWLVSGDVFFIVAFEKECEKSYRPFFYSILAR